MVIGTGEKDAINSGKNGILVHQNNVEETAEAMRKIISDKALWNEMNQESIECAKIKFS